MNQEIVKQIKIMFSNLRSQSAASGFPKEGSLSGLLNDLIVKKDLIAKKPSNKTMVAPGKLLTYFATASIEMWLKATHSFIISASLTKASPVWSSVSGYYSSHYVVRGFAHLLGVFKLHKVKCIIKIEMQKSSSFIYRVETKNGNDGEHKFYWKFVNEHPLFKDDQLFYRNDGGTPKSDIAHRNKANYLDHINRFPIFKPLDSEFLNQRIAQIAGMELSGVSIPSADEFPDIETVQIIAYHRIVKFRNFLDEILGQSNRFWKVHRSPSWRPSSLTFSLNETSFPCIILPIIL